MIQGDDPSLRFLPRIRQELDKLPLAEEQKEVFADRLAGNVEFIDLHAGKFTSEAVQPTSSAPSLADKILGVVTRFPDAGFTTEDYLKAIIRRPDIVSVSPDVIVKNINGVVDLFTADGLTTEEYLRAATKQPSLFVQSPETLADNITGLVGRFAADELTDRKYLDAALRLPSLFTMSPSTVESNIREVVARFRDDGLTGRAYLQAALQMPPLFAMSPTTVIRHIEAVMTLADQGIFKPPRRRDGYQNYEDARHPGHAQVIDFLLRNPRYLTLADDNYGVREVHQRLTDGPTDGRFLQRARHTVERELMQHLGHNDPERPVPNDGFVAGAAPPTKEQAERLVLRALMHAGLIKGGSMER